MGVIRGEPIRLVCGSCGRTLDHLTTDRPTRRLDSKVTGTGGRGPHWAHRSGANKTVSFADRTAVVTRMNYRCHPRRCGRPHVFTADRLRDAVERAQRDGRAQLVTGRDV